jgi:hypothetical protein
MGAVAFVNACKVDHTPAEMKHGDKAAWQVKALTEGFNECRYQFVQLVSSYTFAKALSEAYWVCVGSYHPDYPYVNEQPKQTIPEDTQGFPMGVSVTIETRDGSQYVTINARLHMRKTRELPHCYATSYSVSEILRDSDFLKYLAAYR